MGRNPFAAKTAAEIRPKPAAKADAGEDRPERSNERPFERRFVPREHEGILTSVFNFPLRGLVFGLKSLLVVRYLFAHPKEWKL